MPTPVIPTSGGVRPSGRTVPTIGSQPPSYRAPPRCRSGAARWASPLAQAQVFKRNDPNVPGVGSRTFGKARGLKRFEMPRAFFERRFPWDGEEARATMPAHRRDCPPTAGVLSLPTPETGWRPSARRSTAAGDGTHTQHTDRTRPRPQTRRATPGTPGCS